MLRKVSSLVVVLNLAWVLSACSESVNAVAETESTREDNLPIFSITRPVTGLNHAWDVQVLPSGKLLVSERDTAKIFLKDSAGLHQVSFPSSSVWVSGETGLMSLAVDPNFKINQRFYTCQGGNTSRGGHDVRVLSWKLDVANLKATSLRVLIKGFPSSSGRHAGCRLLIGPNGALLVGTGDAATGTTPRNLGSLGGKTLRLNRFSGKPWQQNPYLNSPNLNKRYITSFGHRNIQGLAFRQDGTLWSAEHGTWRDDEINLIRSGGDYGWNPIPGYNESVPMTDVSLPGPQRNAKWSSGDPTWAISGITWVRGRRWGVLNGTLAVASLKNSDLSFMKFDRNGSLVWIKKPGMFDDFGRLRSVTRAPNGDLLVTTDNADGQDGVIRIRAN